MKSFENTLLDSNRDELLLGPNMDNLFFSNKSTMPRESGFSGPTIVKELFCFANSQSFNKSLESISILFCVPPFPGAKNIFFVYLVAVSIQWNVLSLQNLRSRS